MERRTQHVRLLWRRRADASADALFRAVHKRCCLAQRRDVAKCELNGNSLWHLLGNGQLERYLVAFGNIIDNCYSHEHSILDAFCCNGNGNGLRLCYGIVHGLSNRHGLCLGHRLCHGLSHHLGNGHHLGNRHHLGHVDSFIPCA